MWKKSSVQKGRPSEGCNEKILGGAKATSICETPGKGDNDRVVARKDAEEAMGERKTWLTSHKF